MTNKVFYKEVKGNGLNGGKRETTYHVGPLHYTVNHRYSDHDEYSRKQLAIPLFAGMLMLSGYLIFGGINCKHEKEAQGLESVAQR
ncbi:hypothetical protein KW805_00660 [Candidatus Pacearchaeota archaeon]|nr:hypothetical protein [Candidatus Pacearchaeota archaeon]